MNVKISEKVEKIIFIYFFFKQKTAYERRISDWSSDVCSSDLGFAYEWTGISFEEKQSGGQIGLLLGLSFLVVFLLLSALYESWAIPISVLLVVPLGVLGSEIGRAHV